MFEKKCEAEGYFVAPRWITGFLLHRAPLFLASGPENQERTRFSQRVAVTGRVFPNDMFPRKPSRNSERTAMSACSLPGFSEEILVSRFEGNEYASCALMRHLAVLGGSHDCREIEEGFYRGSAADSLSYSFMPSPNSLSTIHNVSDTDYRSYVRNREVDLKVQIFLREFNITNPNCSRHGFARSHHTLTPQNHPYNTTLSRVCTASKFIHSVCCDYFDSGFTRKPKTYSQ